MGAFEDLDAIPPQLLVGGYLARAVHGERLALAVVETLGPGGIWRIPSGSPHAVVGGEAGAVVIDVFSPARADWSAHAQLESRPARWP